MVEKKSWLNMKDKLYLLTLFRGGGGGGGRAVETVGYWWGKELIAKYHGSTVEIVGVGSK